MFNTNISVFELKAELRNLSDDQLLEFYNDFMYGDMVHGGEMDPTDSPKSVVEHVLDGMKWNDDVIINGFGFFIESLREEQAEIETEELDEERVNARIQLENTLSISYILSHRTLDIVDTLYKIDHNYWGWIPEYKISDAIDDVKSENE